MERVWIEPLEETLTVYNLEGEGNQNYYVAGILVHNMCADGTKKNGKTKNAQPSKVTSANQMQQQVQKGQAPKEVDRVDLADNISPQSHIHFKQNEAALNIDGTWHDAGKKIPQFTNKIKKWILQNGWNLPEE